MISWDKRLSSTLLPSRRCPIPIVTGLVVLVSLCGALGQGVSDSATELTLSQFRALVQPGQRPQEKAEAIPRRAEEAFFRLLVAQGTEAATRQSLDRLSGWVKAVQARFEAQNAAALDLETLRFAEATAALRLAQFEAEHRRARQQANSLLRRPLDSPLVALRETLPPKTSEKADTPKEDSGTPLPANQGEKSPPPQETRSELPSHIREIEKLEQELLPQGRDLLAKMYQGYLFGGLPLSTLLWQEREVYQTELQYQSLLANAELKPPPTEQDP